MDTVRITNYADAMRILSDRNSISDRKFETYDHISARDLRFGREVKEFFQQWPMYNDGIGHRDLRIKLLTVFNQHIHSGRDSIKQHIRQLLLGVDAVDEVIVEKLVMFWHANLFGVDIYDDELLMHRSEPLLSMVFFQRFELFDEAKASLSYIKNFFVTRKFQDDGLIANFVRQGFEIGTVMNFLVDSYSPMIAGASTVLYESFRTEMPCQISLKAIKTHVWAALNQLPPFRYINRHVDLADGRRICAEVDVLMCNADPARTLGSRQDKPRAPLTFGVGPHMCLGFQPAMDFFCDLASVAFEIGRQRDFVVRGTPVTAAPVCRINNLLIAASSRGRSEEM